ncbi:hypothetical protein A1O3_07134 [Capronia epimyces CBS 606.96]|uniref:Uncharacterized protein n=1 Tax=Capronia epimyces CBS 606.96 TaxID=1182542 RepID=W9XKZ7_9EURO|nr:uncharacterized protein A1O3_07134 [Capronia epimyces CBS 606.96]EXJ80848.1 hypothetical protein A1O3_07134 [Capronia epimyces CBS 606.96]
MSTYSSNDLRSAAKPFQREKNHNSKWARGAREAYPQHCHQHEYPVSDCHQCLGRPNRRDSDRRVGRGEARHKHSTQNKLSGQAATLARKAFRNEVVDATDGPLANVSDTSEEEDVLDASTAPVPRDADFMYSYDAQAGPRNGVDILSHAINQAVRRFENKETEKLVNNEYDVVDGKETAEFSTDEDELDFEMIDHSHLN